jgi:hypothetical protein
MKGMKQQPIAKLYYPILLVLAVCEVVGLFYFHGQQNFVEFVFLSLSGIFLISSLLSTNWSWVKKRKFRYIGIAIPMSFAIVALRYWNAGDQISSVLLVLFPIVIATNNCISRKIISHTTPKNQVLQEVVRRNISLRDLYGTIECFSAPLFVLTFVAIRSWTYLTSTFWAVFVSTLALFHLFMIPFAIYLYFWNQQRSGNADLSSNPVTNEGGRA